MVALSKTAARMFPVNCLPGPVRDYVVAQAAALDCDPSAVALPALSVMASAIGSTRRLRVKRGWIEPAVLWTAVVTDEGARSRLPRDAAMQPILEREAKALRDYQRRRRVFDSTLPE